jgi:hypothetical protein
MVQGITVVTRDVADFATNGVFLLDPSEAAARPAGRGAR